MSIRWRATPEGKESLRKAKAKYNASPEGKERNRETHADYLAVPENRERKRKSSAAWFATPEGKAKGAASQRRRRARLASTVRVKYVDAEVLDRDDYYCQRCRIKTDRDTAYHDNPRFATVDHIIPLAADGHDALYNLQTLCKTCNLSKNDADVVPGGRGAQRRGQHLRAVVGERGLPAWKQGSRV